jgi:hypothetical protein
MDHAVAKNNVYLQRKEKRTLLHQKKDIGGVISITGLNCKATLEKYSVF